jgi:hypothetical protein
MVPVTLGKILPARRTMPIEDFIISVFVWVDDTLKALFGSPRTHLKTLQVMMKQAR